MSLLVVDDVSKQFEPDQWAVDRVSLAIRENEILCLLGPSGCGKTTLLRIISGLEIPGTGQIIFNGQNITDVPPYQRGLGMMFQDFALFPHKNVYNNIAFGLQMENKSDHLIKERVIEMLDLVDLEGFEDREIDQLSGGEQQRVALARALAPSPRILMLDEPLGALDRALREKLMLELRQILKKVGMTAVYVTHDQTEAFAIADRIAVMNNGRIEQIDTPQKIYSQPANSFVAQFLGLTNLLPGTLVNEDSFLTSIGKLKIGRTTHSSEENLLLLVRPEAGRIVLNESIGSENLFEAVLKLSTFRGRYYQAWIDIDGTEMVLEFGQLREKSGDSFRICLEPNSLMPLPA